jgi:curli production assembly/transport component CsgG
VQIVMRCLYLLFVILLMGLSGCANFDNTGSLNTRPVVGHLTSPGQLLLGAPAPRSPISVAVYDFQDLTGQNKSSITSVFAEFSRAITQGASAILVDALKTAGSGSWFKVVERGYLDSLLRERKLIQDTYLVLKKNPRTKIDPLQFADYLVTGGVVSYDTPVSFASAAGGFAGYEAGVNASKALVTVNLRLVRVRDGVVMKSIDASRPILSASASASAARVVNNSVLSAQASAGLNEATQTAVRECIEAAVYELMRQGVQDQLWTPQPEAPMVAPRRTARS